jgi:hypothetical protein
MAYQLSPGINVSEIDLTSVVPAVSTTTGAIAGVFAWGPLNTPILVSSETDLVSRFGEPVTVCGSRRRWCCCITKHRFCL